MNEAAPHSSVDGHYAQRVYAAVPGGSDEPDGIGVFCGSIYMAGTQDGFAGGYVDWDDDQHTPDHVAKIVWNTDR